MKQPKRNKTVSSPRGSYRQKYRLDPSVADRYGANVSNPCVQPDGRTETGIPVPSEENVEYAREYQQENKL